MITNISYTRSGKNQNDASRYSIVKLYNEQALEQAEEQPNEQAHKQASEQTDEHIIIKLNSFFNYINKGKSNETFENLTNEDKHFIETTLLKLGLYVKNDTIEIIEASDRLLEFQIYYWAIKELHMSPYKEYLSRVTREKLMLIYHNSKKYICKKETYTIRDLLNYFIKSLQYEAEEVFKYATWIYFAYRRELF